MRNFRIKWINALVLLAGFVLCPADAWSQTRRAFLAGLYDARVEAREARNEAEKAEFLLKSGLVTDAPGDLASPVARREALRWCVQSLGLAFEAEMLAGTNPNSGFQDAGRLTDFERGCLAIATRMKPRLFDQGQNFSGAKPLSDKDSAVLLQRVRKIGREGLTLDATLTPLTGLTLWLHRDGVPSGVPRWRVRVDGFKDQEAALAAQKSFKSQGIEMQAIHPLYEWFLRTPLLDDYGQARRVMSVAGKRGLRTRALPSLSNPAMELAPRYWAMLTINPDYWQMVPAIPRDGPRSLAPMSRIVKENGLGAGINAGFFAVTAKDTGYPIGALKHEGELLNRPYAGRSCLGWNDNDEFLLGLLGPEDSIETGDAGGQQPLAPQDWSLEALEGGGGAEGWAAMPYVIQAGPLLLDDGQPCRDPEGFNNALTSARHPRSVVGLTKEGCWFFLAVDGRNGLHASGATLSELTEILRQCGAVCALNLDGGGSTELVVNGRIYNSVSEGKERSVSYGLGVRPR